MYANAGLQLPTAISPEQACFFQEAAVADNHVHCPLFQLLDEEFLSPYYVGVVDDGHSTCKMVQAPTVTEYYMGGEGDLFKAPEAILEEPPPELDPVAAAISIMSRGGDVTTEAIKVSELESVIQEGHLNDLLFHGCEKGLIEKIEIKDSLSELLVEKKTHAVQMDEVAAQETPSNPQGLIQKSVSSGCLNSVEWAITCTVVQDHLLDLQGLDFEVALGLRRAYSEGDIQLLTISDPKMERQKQLSRYREKKSRRKFGKKIKYACRKALADSQPRFRGRFARTGA